MPDIVVRQWKQLHYSVRSGACDDRGANIEDVLSAQILDALTCNAATPATLVLLTGNGGLISFARVLACRLLVRLSHRWLFFLKILCRSGFVSTVRGQGARTGLEC